VGSLLLRDTELLGPDRAGRTGDRPGTSLKELAVLGGGRHLSWQHYLRRFSHLIYSILAVHVNTIKPIFLR